jgi:streptomycin 6-kinase
VPGPALTIPEGLAWWRRVPGGGEWLDSLPRLVAEVAEEWDLRLGEAVEDTWISLVAFAERADGEPVVLKVNFPERESEHEADALAFWDGDGAVRLLAHDPGRRALLLERAVPGTRLWAVDDEGEAALAAVGVLRRVWRPAPATHEYRLLADLAEHWAEELPARFEAHGRPFERSLLDEAVSACRELGPAQGQQIVAHQDFHGGNVLASDRGWLAIDPKPVVGEREFDVASLLRDLRPELSADPSPGARVRRRLDLLVDELGLDRERARLWGIVHALAWGVDADGADPEMVACARRLSEAR